MLHGASNIPGIWYYISCDWVTSISRLNLRHARDFTWCDWVTAISRFNLRHARDFTLPKSPRGTYFLCVGSFKRGQQQKNHTATGNSNKSLVIIVRNQLNPPPSLLLTAECVTTRRGCDAVR